MSPSGSTGWTKPYADDRPANIQGQHDNNNGDPVFTVFNKYHSDGGQSVYNDAELDKLIEAAEVATGDERIAKWQQASRGSTRWWTGADVPHRRLLPGRPGRRVHPQHLEQQRAAGLADQAEAVSFFFAGGVASPRRRHGCAARNTGAPPRSGPVRRIEVHKLNSL